MAGSTSLVRGDEQQVRQVVDDYWVEWLAALSAADPDRPEFRALISGDAEQRVVGVLTQNRALNEVSVRSGSGPMPHKTITVSITGDNAVVKQCVIDDAVKIERTTHETLDRSAQALLMQQTLQRRSSRWVVVENQTLEHLLSGATCDAY